MVGYVGNIEDITAKNTDFRQVLFTGVHTQLVVMSLLPNEEIGLEKHEHVVQFFRVEKGTVKVVMDKVESTLSEGMVVIVPAGTEHNLINVGPGSAKLYTLYSPPNHPAQTVHKTKDDAVVAEHEE